MASIIIFCKTLVKGGAEKQALTLASLLAHNSIDVVVVCWCRKKVDKRNSEFIKANSLKFVGLKGNPLTKFLRFNRIVKRENATVVLSYLTLANFVAGISRLLNKGLITIGGIRTEKLPYIKFIFEKFVHNNLNVGTIFNNYSAKVKFESRGFDSEKIIVIHNAINLSGQRKERQLTDVIGIITVARFVKAKDFRTALLAFKRLVDRNRGLRLRYTLVGYGPMESEIRSLVRRQNLEDKVKLAINPPDVRDYLRDADIYLSTSLFEGLSNSLMEAMVESLPIIATAVGDNGFLVRNDFNGYLVPPGNTEELTSRLEALVRSEEMRKSFGTNSNLLINSDFNEDRLLHSYLDYIGRFTSAFPYKS